jgi:hypothetical protein
MAQVPYKGYPDQNLQDVPLKVDTPPGAFGVGIAQAIEGVGKSISGVGSELWQRAVAMKELENETEAEQGNLKLMGEAGDLHAKYNALQGEERMKAFPKYKQDLMEVHNKIRGSLSNDDSRKRFDRPALQTIGHSIFNGAGAAAAAEKDWVANTASATMDATIKTISDDPLNDDLWEQKKAAIRESAEKVAEARKGAGPGSPIAEDLVLKSISTAARERILSVNHVDPWRAGQIQEDAIAKKELTVADNLMVDNAIRAQRRSIGSTNIANAVYEEGTAKGWNAKQMEDEVRSRSEKADKNDPILGEHAVHALKGRITNDTYIQRQEELANEQTVTGAIIAGAKNPQELRADPNVARAIDALPDKAFKAGIPAQINRINAAKNKDTNRDNYIELEGMRATNPIKFLNEDLSKWQLSDTDMKHFFREQQKVKDAPQSDPRVQQFVTWMRPLMGAEMRSANVYSPPTKAEGAAAGSDYDKFSGLISVGIREYIEEHGKPPKGTEAVKEIGMRALKGVSEPGMLWGTNEVPYFKRTLGKEYEDFKKNLTQESIDKGEGIPTEDQLERTYREMDYTRLYGKKKSSGK